MTFLPKYDIETLVFRITDRDAMGQVTGYIVRKGYVLYLVTWSDGREETMQDFEITDIQYEPLAE